MNIFEYNFMVQNGQGSVADGYFSQESSFNSPYFVPSTFGCGSYSTPYVSGGLNYPGNGELPVCTAPCPITWRELPQNPQWRL